MKRLKDIPFVITLMMLAVLFPGGDVNDPGVHKLGLRRIAHRCGFQNLCCDSLAKCLLCQAACRLGQPTSPPAWDPFGSCEPSCVPDTTFPCMAALYPAGGIDCELANSTPLNVIKSFSQGTGTQVVASSYTEFFPHATCCGTGYTSSSLTYVTGTADNSAFITIGAECNVQIDTNSASISNGKYNLYCGILTNLQATLLRVVTVVIDILPGSGCAGAI